jgi:hypothetical protein
MDGWRDGGRMGGRGGGCEDGWIDEAAYKTVKM